MTVSLARSAAFDILLRVERESSYASELLHSGAYEPLSAADHGLATELVMGVLRWRSALDQQIAGASSQALSKLDCEILIALRIGLYQLRELDRIPARAAIHESVELVKRARKRSAAPFVNAVLRKLAADTAPGHQLSKQEDIPASPAALAQASAHPLWMVERWAREYGLDAASRICQHDQTVPATAIRLRSVNAERELLDAGIELARGGLLASAHVVQSGDITGSSSFREARVVIQDEASQLVAALVGRGSKILDCCAAPGGKTLAIADRNSNASITAVEIHPHRARLLEKLMRTGEGTVTIGIVVADARNLSLPDGFDRVLADVPCSGTGTLARNPEIKWRLRQEHLAELHELQCGILRSALAQVARGGRVVYSTCSLEREENEDVVERVLGDDVRLIDCRGELARLKDEGELLCADPAALTRGPYLRTLPGVHPCDGFFAAILERA